MATFLFNDIIFGPVISRRLGVSLGINLLPANRKVCSFNCIYCECGLNPKGTANQAHFPESDEVINRMEKKLKEMSEKSKNPDVITFAGNGEPTLHPNFSEIIDETIRLRNIYCPKTHIAVLSNATMAHIPKVFNALLKIDRNIQKLDSVFPETVKLLNNPANLPNLTETVDVLKKFYGRVIIQTLFVKGNLNGIPVDNSTDLEVSAWLNILKEISPRYVMIYSIARETPVKTIEKIPRQRMAEIYDLLQQSGIPVQVTY